MYCKHWHETGVIKIVNINFKSKVFHFKIKKRFQVFKSFWLHDNTSNTAQNIGNGCTYMQTISFRNFVGVVALEKHLNSK